jgi:hypothetical protein
MDHDNSEILGKKIFFLYPSAIIQNEIAADLTQQEYEVYLVKNHLALHRVLKQFSDSMVFVNIDDGISEKEWEAWIRGVMSDPATASVGIGILSAAANETLQRKYITSVQVKCGYTVIKPDISKAIVQLMEFLTHFNARGRRKYIRVSTDAEAQATINIPFNNQYIRGTIKDISVAGLSCILDHDPEFKKNTLCKDIQIRLQSMILKIEGIIFGFRMDGNARVNILLFTQRIDPDVKAKIRKYMQSILQEKMDALLK